MDDILQYKKLDVKLKEYNDSITLLDVKDVSTDSDYQYGYSDFFDLRYFGSIRGKKFTPEQKQELLHQYFSVLQQEKSNKQMTMERAKQIYNDVCLITGCAEISFSSKLIHVIDTSYPIYDRVVGKDHFGFYCTPKKRNETLDEYKARVWDMYVRYKNAFVKYVKESEDAKAMIKILQQSDKFSSYKFSDVKLVDFVLWQDRKKVKENKVIRPQQIEIPQEFKCQR